jgi:hypothetical protein
VEALAVELALLVPLALPDTLVVAVDEGLALLE